VLCFYLSCFVAGWWASACSSASNCLLPWAWRYFVSSSWVHWMEVWSHWSQLWSWLGWCCSSFHSSSLVTAAVAGCHFIQTSSKMTVRWWMKQDLFEFGCFARSMVSCQPISVLLCTLASVAWSIVFGTHFSELQSTVMKIP
jgi:hypothetical protein